mgnify:FL=1
MERPRGSPPLANPLLHTGKRAPAFTLPSTEGEPFRLTEMRGLWVVAFFYAKDMRNGCVAHAEAFRDSAKDFDKEGAVVVGLCADSLESHQVFVQKSALNFPLLVDKDFRVATKYGAWREKKGNGSRYLGLVRSTFLIDPSGKVARVWDNVRSRSHVEKVLASLQEEKLR